MRENARACSDIPPRSVLLRTSLSAGLSRMSESEQQHVEIQDAGQTLKLNPERPTLSRYRSTGSTRSQEEQHHVMVRC